MNVANGRRPIRDVDVRSMSAAGGYAAPRAGERTVEAALVSARPAAVSGVAWWRLLVRGGARVGFAVLRPVLRPLAWRVRGFLLRDLAPEMVALRQMQGGIAEGVQALAAQAAGQAGGQGVTVRPVSAVAWVPRRQVHQFHAGSASGDAITNAMLLIQRVLREMGFASEIYVEQVGAGLEGRVHPVDALPAHDGLVLLVHHSMGHASLERLLAHPAPKVLVYHNITPPELLSHNPHAQRGAVLGRVQLEQLRPAVVAALADSVFNGMELRRLGFGCVQEAALLFDVARLEASARTVRAEGPFTVLFVGRIVPSKGQVALVEAFAVFARAMAEDGRAVRLLLAGDCGACGRPWRVEIEQRVRALGLEGQVVLTGKLSDAALAQCWAEADIYVSLSRHEGFGVPLVEAMAQGVPVVALRVAAVAEAMGGAGVLLDDDAPDGVAAALLRVAVDPALGREIVAEQRAALWQWAWPLHLPALRTALSLAGAAVPVQESTRQTLIRTVRIVTSDAALAQALEREQPGRVSKALRGWEVGMFATIQRDAPACPQPGVTLVLSDAAGPPAPAMVRRLNMGAQGVLVETDEARRQFVDSGVMVPIRVVGYGADLAPFAAVGAARAGQGRPMTRRFLHVCAPGLDGLDALLFAWARAFSADEDVCLVLQVRPTGHRAVVDQLAALRRGDPDIAAIHVRHETLVELCAQADILVQPASGCGGIARQAAAAGLAVIASAEGQPAIGHRLAYRLRPVCDAAARGWALQVEPDPQDLADALRAARARTEIVLLPEKPWAERVVAATADLLLAAPACVPRLAIVSPWRVRCGIAEYTRHLVEGFNRTGFVDGALPVILADDRPTEPGTRAVPGLRVRPAFRAGDPSGMAELAIAIGAEDPDVLIIQHQPGVLPWAGLAELLASTLLACRCVVVVLHNTRDLLCLAPELRESVCRRLATVCRVLVHAASDIVLLQELGISNTIWLPHGTTPGPRPRLPRSLHGGTAPIIGTTGFLLPHKGVQRLIRAAALLRRHWPDLRLHLLMARHPDPSSEAEFLVCTRLAEELGLAGQIDWDRDFAPNEAVLDKLSRCDLIVMPYAATLESSSGAVRQAIASGAPTLVSDLPLFDDLGAAVERLTQTTPEAIALQIATLLNSPGRRQAIQSQAQAWLAHHDWSLIAERVQALAHAVALAAREEVR